MAEKKDKAKHGAAVKKKVLVVNNGTQYMGELHEKVKTHAKERADVDTVNLKDVKNMKNLHEYAAIILSGSTHRGYKNTAHQYVLDNANKDAYILGICHGHQSLAYLHGGKVENLGTYTKGHKEVDIVKDDEVIGPKGKVTMYKVHKYGVTDVGSELETIAESTVKDADGKSRKIVEAYKHKSKNIYGIQGHPEKGGHGEEMLYRLLTKAYG